MNNIFAKIFAVSDAQVLVIKEGENKDLEFELSIRTDIRGITRKITLSYLDESKANDVFLKFEQKDAEEFFSSMDKSI